MIIVQHGPHKYQRPMLTECDALRIILDISDKSLESGHFFVFFLVPSTESEDSIEHMHWLRQNEQDYQIAH